MIKEFEECSASSTDSLFRLFFGDQYTVQLRMVKSLKKEFDAHLGKVDNEEEADGLLALQKALGAVIEIIQDFRKYNPGGSQAFAESVDILYTHLAMEPVATLRKPAPVLKLMFEGRLCVASPTQFWTFMTKDKMEEHGLLEVEVEAERNHRISDQVAKYAQYGSVGDIRNALLEFEKGAIAEAANVHLTAGQQEEVAAIAAIAAAPATQSFAALGRMVPQHGEGPAVSLSGHTTVVFARSRLYDPISIWLLCSINV